jgi:hypothetical protein
MTRDQALIAGYMRMVIHSRLMTVTGELCVVVALLLHYCFLYGLLLTIKLFSLLLGAVS